ncbi:MAG: SBBP repeat-containing protein [Crocinitomicaceae bacterium]
MFIAKLDANGNYLWAKSAGESSLDFGFSIAVDNQGNSYVTGRFRGSVAFGSTTLATYGSLQIFITKLDTNGNFLWAKQAGDWNGNATGCSIAVDNQEMSLCQDIFHSSQHLEVRPLQAIIVMMIFS